VASSQITRPRGMTKKRRTTTTNSSSSHHHDSASSRPHPLICGADPPSSQPTQSTILALALKAKRSFFCLFGGVYVFACACVHVCMFTCVFVLLCGWVGMCDRAFSSSDIVNVLLLSSQALHKSSYQHLLQ